MRVVVHCARRAPSGRASKKHTQRVRPPSTLSPRCCRRAIARGQRGRWQTDAGPAVKAMTPAAAPAASRCLKAPSSVSARRRARARDCSARSTATGVPLSTFRATEKLVDRCDSGAPAPICWRRCTKCTALRTWTPRALRGRISGPLRARQARSEPLQHGSESVRVRQDAPRSSNYHAFILAASINLRASSINSPLRARGPPDIAQR